MSAGAAEGPAYGPERVDLSRTDPDGDDATVVDLLDRLLEGGVMIHGDVTLSLAGIDLLYVGLRLVVKVPDDGPGP